MADNSPASGATARPLPISKPPVSGLNFCLGNWTAMGTDVVAAIRHFAPRGQIVYGHIQGVQGTVPSFRESFLDDADADFLTIFRALAESGFDIVLCPGHNPHTVYDTERGDIGMAHAFGFVQGLLKALG